MQSTKGKLKGCPQFKLKLGGRRMQEWEENKAVSDAEVCLVKT